MLRRLVREGLNNSYIIKEETYGTHITMNSMSKMEDILNRKGNWKDYSDEKALKEIISNLIMEKSEYINSEREYLEMSCYGFIRKKTIILLEQVNNGEIKSINEYETHRDYWLFIGELINFFIFLLIYICDGYISICCKSYQI